MTSFVAFSEFGTILDALAIACCLAMMLMVLRHRRVCKGKSLSQTQHLSNEMALETVSRQSQKVYANLQKALEKEFQALHPSGSNDEWVMHADHPQENQGLPNRNNAAGTSDRRSYRFRQAEQMLARGTDGHMIMRHCALKEGELDLLIGLQQFRKSLQS